MYAVEMLGITKRFPGMVANEKVDLRVEKGEIHCLLGENGAGKTTLMKVLFGLYAPDEGSLAVKGKAVPCMSPNLAYKLGLGMVHQHFMLVENLTVLENIILGCEPGGRMRIDRKKARRELMELSAQYGFALRLDEPVSALSVGEKQRVEIMKTIYRGADIIILDEPTAVLTPLEVEQLLQILKDMRSSGKTIIFITHKLNETMEVADRVTVLRGGKLAAMQNTADTSARELASLMVGRDISLEVEKEPRQPGAVVLRLQNLKLTESAQDTVSLEVRGGEILGIAGVEGNGQQELEEMLVGLLRCKQGSIELKGRDITALPPKIRRDAGLGYIPADRLKYAVLPDASLRENYLLGNQFSREYTGWGLVRQRHLAEKAARLMQDFDVRAVSAEQSLGSLSGGNQQKVVLGREVGKEPELVLACQPTRGLDIGAIQYVHSVLLRLRSEGKAVVLISAELNDLFQLSDQIGVLYKGSLMALRPAAGYTNESISLLMAGRKEEDDAPDA